MLAVPSGSPLVVRPAATADVSALAEIRNASWRSAYVGILPDSELRRMTDRRSQLLIHETLRRRGSFALLVEDAAGPFGYTLAGPQPRRILPFRGEVYELYLHPSRQRRGAGTRLLTSTLWELSTRGLTPAMLWVLERNDARHFYAGCGGRMAGRSPVEIGGRSLQRIAYGWDEFLPLPMPN
jgi:GNAT superfamily N-acetyltransferase